MSEKVYVVMGETGEYSDRAFWHVVAYRDEEAAKAHVQRAEAWLMKNGVHCDAPNPGGIDYEDREALVGQNPEDPNMKVPEYYGSRYFYFDVELRS
jgi:hypothetical protein